MVRHRLAYVGHESSRGTLKYRGPARHAGWTCPSDARCHRAGRYGMVVRIKKELDLRRVPRVPRAAPRVERLCKRRGGGGGGEGRGGVPADPAGDPAVRAAVQGADGGGAGEGPMEARLGCR